MMRVRLLAGMVAIALAAPAPAQEEVGTTEQGQTAAPNVSLDRPQPGTCGAAPSVAQINRLVPVIRRMFPQPRSFDDALKGEIRKSCQRNRAAAYLLRVIAANNWAAEPVASATGAVCKRVMISFDRISKSDGGCADARIFG